MLCNCIWTITNWIIFIRKVTIFFVLLMFRLCKVLYNLIGRKHVSNLGDKLGQLSREVRMSGGRANESYQFLADKVAKGRFEPEACPDHLSRLALLGPNVMCCASIHSPLPPVISVDRRFSMEPFVQLGPPAMA